MAPQMSDTEDAPPADATTTEVGRRHTRPREMLVRGALTVILIGLVGWLLLSNFGEISQVWDALAGVSATDAVVLVLRSWGFYTDDFARSWLFTSALTNFTVLSMPALAIVLVATQNSVSTGLLILGLVGLVISLVAGYCIIRIMRSEAFARRFGALTGRLVRWCYGLARRSRATRTSSRRRCASERGSPRPGASAGTG